MAETKGRATAATHPLDPLTAEEISSAVEILRKERDLGEKVRFAGIVVNEPPKEQVLSFNPGDYFGREALVVLVDGEEEAGQKPTFQLADNRCGCDGQEVTCQIRTQNIAPPAPP